MRITQGTFSFLPDLTDDEIRAQIDYALEQGWAIGVGRTFLRRPLFRGSNIRSFAPHAHALMCSWPACRMCWRPRVK